MTPDTPPPSDLPETPTTTYLWEITIRSFNSQMMMRMLGTRRDVTAVVMSYRPPGQECWIGMKAIDADPVCF